MLHVSNWTKNKKKLEDLTKNRQNKHIPHLLKIYNGFVNSTETALGPNMLPSLFNVVGKEGNVITKF